MGGFGEAFQKASMKDQLDYMKEFNPSFAKADPKTQADYLNEIHYSGERAPTVPSTEPGGIQKPAVGRELALGALGTVAPETQHPITDLAKSFIPSAKDVGLTALTGGMYPMVKAGMGVGQQLYGAGKEIMPILPKLTPGGGMGSTITPEEAEKAAHGAGTIAGYGIMAAAPEVARGVSSATAPLRNAIAERTAGSLIGPEPKNVFEVSRPAPAFVKEGPMALTLKGLSKNLEDRISDYNDTVQSALKQASAAPPENPHDIIRNATQPIIDQARAGLDERAATAVEKWRDDALKRVPNSLKLDELYKLKQDIGKTARTYKGGQADEPGLKEARQAVSSAINERIGQRIPGLRDITQRESGLIQARDQVENKARLQSGGPLVPGLRLFAGEGTDVGGGGLSMRLAIPGETLAKTALIKAIGSREALPPPIVPPAATAGGGIPPSGPTAPTGGIPPIRPTGRVVNAQVVNPAGPAPVSYAQPTFAPHTPLLQAGTPTEVAPSGEILKTPPEQPPQASPAPKLAKPPKTIERTKVSRSTSVESVPQKQYNETHGTKTLQMREGTTETGAKVRPELPREENAGVQESSPANSRAETQGQLPELRGSLPAPGIIAKTAVRSLPVAEIPDASRRLQQAPTGGMAMSPTPPRETSSPVEPVKPTVAKQEMPQETPKAETKGIVPAEAAAPTIEAKAAAPEAKEAATSDLMERRDALEKERAANTDPAAEVTLTRKIGELNRAIGSAGVAAKIGETKPATPWGKSKEQPVAKETSATTAGVPPQQEPASLKAGSAEAETTAKTESNISEKPAPVAAKEEKPAEEVKSNVETKAETKPVIASAPEAKKGAVETPKLARKITPSRAPSEIEKTKPLNMEGKTRPEKVKAPPAPAFVDLHPNSQTKFNAAWDEKNADSLKELLYPENKGLRAEFEKRSGISLPKTINGTRQAIDDFISRSIPPEIKRIEEPPKPLTEEEQKVKDASDKQKPNAGTGLTKAQSQYLAEKLGEMKDLPIKTFTDGQEVTVHHFKRGSQRAIIKGEVFKDKNTGERTVELIPIGQEHAPTTGKWTEAVSDLESHEAATIRVPGDGTFKIPSIEAAQSLQKKAIGSGGYQTEKFPKRIWSTRPSPEDLKE